MGSDNGSPLVEFFNGTSWSVQTTPAISGGGTLNAVTAISPTDVWAVGNTGTGEGRGQLIENFNGTSWSIVQSPSSEGALTGISAVSSADIFAVGGGGKDVPNEVLQFNGTTWSVLPNTPDAVAVDAISATDVWVVGSGNLSNFNGTTWTQAAFSNGNTANDFDAISGTASNNIYAVGDGFSSSNGLQTGFGTIAAVERHELEPRHQREPGQQPGRPHRSDGLQQRARRGGRQRIGHDLDGAVATH